jgi:hypothetical protein
MCGVFSQAMLINRSPLLNYLDNEAFARLREHPATNAHQGELLFALQSAVAAIDPAIGLCALDMSACRSSKAPPRRITEPSQWTGRRRHPG